MMKNIQSKVKWSSSLLAAIIFVLVILGCENSKAKGKLIASGCEPSAGFINGEPDYGVEAKLKIKNVGQSGKITISPAISTSEGEWKRTQTLIFDEGEEKTLTYFFHEPTVNVSSVQCQYSISPKAN